MKLYAIRRWDELFENNRSRELSSLKWVIVPNRHDGETFTRMITHKEGSKMFAAWVLILQVASKCDPRGTLVRGDKTPLDSVALSLKTRAPIEWFEITLDWLEKNSDWLVITGTSHLGAVLPQDSAEKPQGGDTERKGKERNGIYSPECRVILHFINEQTGKKFRETSPNLEIIQARLKEDGVDLEGVKQMICRQVLRWKGTEQEEYLRPETLFRKSKFDGYYAAREQPVNHETNKRNPPQRVDRNIGTTNEGKSSQYRGMGQVAKNGNPERPAA